MWKSILSPAVGNCLKPFLTRAAHVPASRKAVRNNYLRQAKRIQYYDRLQLEVISESDLLPPKIKKQAAADLGQYPKFTDKYTETDRCPLTGAILGVVNDYKITRHFFRDLARKGNISGLKFWRFPNYSRWDKEKLCFRLLQLQNDSYYKQFTKELCNTDPEFNSIFKRKLREEKIGAQTDDYVWCMRRNYTPDKWNEDYRF